MAQERMGLGAHHGPARFRQIDWRLFLLHVISEVTLKHGTKQNDTNIGDIDAEYEALCADAQLVAA